MPELELSDCSGSQGAAWGPSWLHCRARAAREGSERHSWCCPRAGQQGVIPIPWANRGFSSQIRHCASEHREVTIPRFVEVKVRISSLALMILTCLLRAAACVAPCDSAGAGTAPRGYYSCPTKKLNLQQLSLLKYYMQPPRTTTEKTHYWFCASLNYIAVNIVEHLFMIPVTACFAPLAVTCISASLEIALTPI